MIEITLKKLVGQAPGIDAKIGNRIFPLTIPQGEKRPAITYMRVGGLPDYDNAGATKLEESRFFLWFHGEKTNSKSAYLQALECRQLVKDYFEVRGGFREFVGTVEIQGIFINSASDQPEETATKEQVARLQLDVTIWHRETKGN